MRIWPKFYKHWMWNNSKICCLKSAGKLLLLSVEGHSYMELGNYFTSFLVCVMTLQKWSWKRWSEYLVKNKGGPSSKQREDSFWLNEVLLDQMIKRED